MATRKKSRSFLRNLGEFCGHIAAGAKSKPDQPTRVPQPPPVQVVREHVQQAEVQTPHGKVVLRRRIIDEVEPAGPTKA